MADRTQVPYLCHWLAVLLILGGFLTSAAGGSTFLYKQYLLKQDRGENILCEPYQVQQGDWVYKIFRRKGEISENDFPQFVQIFGRINPHIEDLDRIQVGDRILIPLKRMDHQGESLNEVGGDVLTMPFVTISNAAPPARAPSGPQMHRVQSGDTIHRLIATQFGPQGPAAFETAMARFRELNPQIKDLDKIYVGQAIRLPVPGQLNPPEMDSGLVPQEPEPSIMDLKPPEKARSGPMVKAVQTATESLALVLGEQAGPKGQYHFPVARGSDVVLDMDETPLLTLPDGRRLLVVQGGGLAPADVAVVQKYWPDLHVLDLDSGENMMAQFGRLFETCGAVRAPPNVIVQEPGLTLAVRFNWLLNRSLASSGAREQRIGVVVLGDAAEFTPAAVQRYLAGWDVIMHEIVPGRTGMQLLSVDPRPLEISVVRALITTDERRLVTELLETMAFNCTPNGKFSFNYAGMELDGWMDFVENKDGEEIFLNFGQLQGEALDVLKESGHTIVDLNRRMPLRDKLVALFQALDVSCTYDPVFWAAARPANYNTSITVSGILASPLIGRQFIITPFAFSAPALQIFKERGIQVIQLAMAADKRRAAGWD